MNNFDDIFEASAAPEIPEAEPKAEKPQRQWWQIKEERQRQEARSTLQNIFQDFSEGRGNLKAFLDVYSRFDRYSARNALLIMAKKPEATRIGDYRFWERQGVEVLKTERRSPIIILEPGKTYQREDGSIGQNFYAKEVYDISQTTARGQEQPRASYDQRLLLKALISHSPIPIRAVEALPDEGRGAMISPEQNAILVRKGMGAEDIFRCVSVELAHVQIARANEHYSREREGYKGYCVSYMLCKKYGIYAACYNVDRLTEVFKGKDPREEIPAHLTDMENAMGSINSRMARVLGAARENQQKEQER